MPACSTPPHSVQSVLRQLRNVAMRPAPVSRSPVHGIRVSALDLAAPATLGPLNAGPCGKPARLGGSQAQRKRAALARLTWRVPENIALALVGGATLASPHVPLFVKI